MASPAPAEQSTTLVCRKVKPGCQEDYIAWLHHMMEAASRFPGYLGSVAVNPDPQTPGRYLYMIRFVNEAASLAWEASHEFAQLIEEAESFSTPAGQKASGLEAWFVLPGSTLEAPPKWKMVLALFPIGYLLSSVMIPVVNALFPHWPFLATNVLGTAVLVVALTYVGAPFMTYLLRSWLYPQEKKRKVR